MSIDMENGANPKLYAFMKAMDYDIKDYHNKRSFYNRQYITFCNKTADLYCESKGIKHIDSYSELDRFSIKYAKNNKEVVKSWFEE